MTEPKRWIDERPPEAIARLLEAAASEQPADASVARTLGVLGIGAGVAGAASTAGAATAGATLGAATVGKASGVFALGTFAKWGLLATAVTAAGVAGKVVTSAPASSPSAVHASVSSVKTATTPRPALESAPVAPAAPPLEPEAPPVVAETPPVAQPSPPVAKTPLRSAAAAPAAPAPAEAPIDAERLAEEIAFVNQARGALARGDARSALRALDDYDARFTERRFVPEALYLRMESRLKLGQAAEARVIAERLARSFPSSPHTARARQVLSQPIP